jgi:hypothetical protein
MKTGDVTSPLWIPKTTRADILPANLMPKASLRDLSAPTVIPLLREGPKSLVVRLRRTLSSGAGWNVNSNYLLETTPHQMLQHPISSDDRKRGALPCPPTLGLRRRQAGIPASLFPLKTTNGGISRFVDSAGRDSESGTVQRDFLPLSEFIPRKRETGKESGVPTLLPRYTK